MTTDGQQKLFVRVLAFGDIENVSGSFQNNVLTELTDVIVHLEGENPFGEQVKGTVLEYHSPALLSTSNKGNNLIMTRMHPHNGEGYLVGTYKRVD